MQGDRVLRYFARQDRVRCEGHREPHDRDLEVVGVLLRNCS